VHSNWFSEDSLRYQDCYNAAPVAIATKREGFVSSLKERLQYNHEVALKALINSKEVSKRYYDIP
jgi:hypothetical protein